MASVVRYQVFLSSTYEDLREERQQATQAVLESGNFPAGMELFPASDDAQWELIKRVIEECDYYIVIVAARYGSIGPSGLSYTEMEYDYAVDRGIPILGFVRNNIEKISFELTEKTEDGRRKLELFRAKVLSRMCRRYDSPGDLGMLVMKSLMAESRIRPRMGWVRANQARSEDEILRERQMADELAQAQNMVEKLERKLRDRAILADDIPYDELAQGNNILTLTVTFSEKDKTVVSENIDLTWDELFKVIGPTLYGFVWRKRSGYGQYNTYNFQDNLEEHIRAKIIDRVQNRKVKI